jgi:hypothetical protein
VENRKFNKSKCYYKRLNPNFTSLIGTQRLYNYKNGSEDDHLLAQMLNLRFKVFDHINVHHIVDAQKKVLNVCLSKVKNNDKL